MSALSEEKEKWRKASQPESLKVGESVLLGIEQNGNIIPMAPGSGVSTGVCKGGVMVTKFGPLPFDVTYGVIDSISFMRVVSGDDSKPLEVVDISIFEGKEEAEISYLHASAGIGFTLVGGEVSIFDFNLGAGLSNEIGTKDYTFTFKVAGVGVSVGKKIAVSVFDNSFGIDVVRTAGGIQFIAKTIAYSLKYVPRDMASGAAGAWSEAQKIPGAVVDGGSRVASEIGKLPGIVTKDIPHVASNTGNDFKNLGKQIVKAFKFW